MEKIKITYRGKNDLLIWKALENEIDERHVIICPPTHEVIFIKEGTLEEIYNQGSHMPIKNKIFKKGQTALCEIIYVNKSIEFNIYFGTPSRLNIMNPYTNEITKLGASGTYSISIDNTRRLYEKILSNEDTLNIEKIKEYFTDSILYIVKKEISNLMMHDDVNFSNIYLYLDEVSTKILENLKNEFYRAGLSINKFQITNVIVDDDVIKNTAKEKNIYCPKCGTQNISSNKFCHSCGYNLSIILRCDECNNIVLENNLYCSNCGKKLKERCINVD